MVDLVTSGMCPVEPLDFSFSSCFIWTYRTYNTYISNGFPNIFPMDFPDWDLRPRSLSDSRHISTSPLQEKSTQQTQEPTDLVKLAVEAMEHGPFIDDL